MSISFATLTAMPNRFTAGEVIAWTETLADYPASAYSVAYDYVAQATPLDGFQKFAIAGVGVGTTWTFTTPSGPKPGSYAFERQITKTAGSVMRVDKSGCGRLVVLPNYTTTPTVTDNAAMVTALKAIMALFATSTDQSVSFNGQSYSRANIGDYQKQLVYFQAQVIAEQQSLANLSGCGQGNRVGVQFLPSSSVSPYGPCSPGVYQ